MWAMHPCVLPGMPETFEADDFLIGRAFAAAESIKPGHPHRTGGYRRLLVAKKS